MNNIKLLLPAFAKKQLSDSGGRKVVDKMFDVSLNRRIVEWSGTDRPEFTDFGGSKVCVEAERTNLFNDPNGFDEWGSINGLNLHDEEEDPLGGQNGWIFESLNGGVNVNVRQSVVFSGIHTASVWLKKVTTDWAALRMGSSLVYFDLENGEVGNIGASFSSATITPGGKGWYLCEAVIDNDEVSGSEFRIYGAVSGNGVVDSVEGAQLRVYFAQFEEGSFATLRVDGTRLAPTVTIEDALPVTGTVAGKVDMVRTVGAYQYIFDSSGDTSTARTQIIIHENGNILARAYGGDGGLISEPFPFEIGDNERFALRYAMSWDADSLYLFLQCNDAVFFRSTSHQINDSTYTGVWLGQPRGGGTSYSSFRFLIPWHKDTIIRTTEEEFEQLFEVIS